MAGFAVVMGMLMFGFVGTVVATLLSVLLVQLAKRRISSNRTVKWQLGLAPFIGVGWIAAAFLIHVFVSHHFAHQDCGLGMSPDPFVTLPNGYTLGSHNTYDGYIVAPGRVTDVSVTGPGYVRSIVSLRLNGNQFDGTLFDFKSSQVRHFSFDAKTQATQVENLANRHEHIFDSTDPASVIAWSKANTEAQTGVDSYWNLYRQYRHVWPSYLFLLLILVGEGGVVYGAVRVWRSKRVH